MKTQDVLLSHQSRKQEIFFKMLPQVKNSFSAQSISYFLGCQSYKFEIVFTKRKHNPVFFSFTFGENLLKATVSPFKCWIICSLTSCDKLRLVYKYKTFKTLIFRFNSIRLDLIKDTVLSLTWNVILFWKVKFRWFNL